MAKAKNPKPPIELDKNYPLGIKSTVHGREKRGNHVYFFIDPKGNDLKKGRTELVVLKRWRKKIKANYSFSGSTLNPKIWRSLSPVFGNDPNKWISLSVKEITDYLQSARIKHLEATKFLPSASILAVIFKVCGAKNLEDLIERHTNPERAEIFGTPDLFLYSTNSKNKEIWAVFIEVKRKKEEFVKGQLEEIAYLQSLKLNAGVFRLNKD
jgi:hypothetical protein